MADAPRDALPCLLALSGWLIGGAMAHGEGSRANGAERKAAVEPASSRAKSGRRARAARPHRLEHARDARLAARPLAGAARAKAYSRSNVEEANSWLIFGFTEGADVGAKGEWTRFYDSVLRATGLLLDQWAGAALYAGPTAFILLGAQGYFGIAWSVRIAQDAAASSAPARDFEGFDRHQIRVKAGISF